TTTCIAVSIEGVSPGPCSGRRLGTRSSHKLTGTKISSRPACASHFPEALIHRVPSTFTDVFPEPAWTNSRLRPRRAETSTKSSILEWIAPDTIPAPVYSNRLRLLPRLLRYAALLRRGLSPDGCLR